MQNFHQEIKILIKEKIEHFDLKVIMTFQLCYLMDRTTISAFKKCVTLPNIYLSRYAKKKVCDFIGN